MIRWACLRRGKRFLRVSKIKFRSPSFPRFLRPSDLALLHSSLPLANLEKLHESNLIFLLQLFQPLLDKSERLSDFFTFIHGLNHQGVFVWNLSQKYKNQCMTVILLTSWSSSKDFTEKSERGSSLDSLKPTWGELALLRGGDGSISLSSRITGGLESLENFST